jgi:hypothetical protein
LLRRGETGRRGVVRESGQLATAESHGWVSGKGRVRDKEKFVEGLDAEQSKGCRIVLLDRQRKKGGGE